MGIDTRVVFHTKEVIRSMEQTAAKRVYEAANEVRNVTLETLSGNRSGRTYYVPGTRKKYTASAPGQPPAQATGRLRKSVKVKVESGGKKVVGIVGTDLDYGKALELGTRKMAPRPWLKVSFEKAFDKVKNILGKEWM